jgi:FMN-dependent NADH-azoreductase
MFNFFKILYICLITTLTLYGEKKMTILHIDSSINSIEQSASRTLSAKVVQHLIKNHADAKVEYLDLIAEKIPAIDSSFFTMKPEDNKFLQQFLKADVIVIGAPMYNFGVPSQLKSWFDQIAIAGQTFKFVDGKPVGLVTGKKAFIISTRGGVYDNGKEILDHQEPFIKTILGFMGICDATIIRAEGMSMADKKDAALAEAEAAIQRITF